MFVVTNLLQDSAKRRSELTPTLGSKALGKSQPSTRSLPCSSYWEERATNLLSLPVAVVAAWGGRPEEEVGKGKAQGLELGLLLGFPPQS